MSRVKSKDTGPELKLRKALWALGYRYRLRYKIPGKPDIVFVAPKVVVFIDGCFWHGCPIHGTIPRTNEAFWSEKINKNIARDQRVNTELTELGWKVIRYWEHEIKSDFDSCIKKITTELAQRGIRGTTVKAKRSRGIEKETRGTD